MRRVTVIFCLMLLAGCRTFEVGVVQTPTPMLRATTEPSTATALTPATSPIQAPTMSPASTATIAPIVTITPTCTASPTPASTSQSMKYYWPASLPANFTIRPCSSTVDEQGFRIEAGAGGKIPWPVLTISAGNGINNSVSLPPCDAGYHTITIHGEPGCMNIDNNGLLMHVFWHEGSTIYSIDSGGMSLEETLAIGEASQALDYEAFQRNLAPYVTPTPNPSGPLVYYWPAKIPAGLVIDTDRSSVDDNGFVLALESLENDGRSGMIWGGSMTRLDEACDVTLQLGIVRGQSGYLGMGTGAGFGVAWRENGHPYEIGGIGMSLQDVQAIADALEPVDQITWQQRLTSER
jgi:hypothetical protein